MATILLLTLMATLMPSSHSTTCKTHPPHHPIHKAPKDLLRRIAKSNPQSLQFHNPAAPTKLYVGGGGLRVDPTKLGGDPTGTKDSWEALNAAISVCLNQSSLSPNGYFPGQDTTPEFGPIGDMGGCEIDLGGGEFRISKPLVLPEMNANMQFGFGSLVATPDFKGDFLFIIGKPGSCKFPQGSCNIDINFPELFLDGARVTSGMQINNVMGVTIGPGGYFLNFTKYGLQINAGHEVMMDRCWLGETNFDFDHEQHGVKPNATAIQINGNDHYILNTIVFSSLVGLEINGAADYISGVHVWFPVNHAVHFADSMAFHITNGGNRLMGCYIDGGRAVFEENALKRNIWTNGFECCQRGPAAPNTTASGILLKGNSLGPGLEIMNNEFGGGQIYTSASADVSVTGVLIAHNSNSHGVVKGTQATQSVTSKTQQKTWNFDFCDKLLFPRIAVTRVHVSAQDGFPVAVARPTQDCKLVVETNPPMIGTITVEVDSSA